MSDFMTDPCMWVGGLPEGIPDEEVTTMLGEWAGKSTQIQVKTPRFKPGYAFVGFPDEATRDAAVAALAPTATGRVVFEAKTSSARTARRGPGGSYARVMGTSSRADWRELKVCGMGMGSCESAHAAEPVTRVLCHVCVRACTCIC